jgi:hypothetical protein
MAVSSNQQRVMWEFISDLKREKADKANGIGPYKTAEGGPVERYGGCSNYDTCLDFAAYCKWGGFTCRGCFRFDKFLETKGRDIDDEARSF